MNPRIKAVPARWRSQFAMISSIGLIRASITSAWVCCSRSALCKVDPVTARTSCPISLLVTVVGYSGQR
jgi:hypothetical protein